MSCGCQYKHLIADPGFASALDRDKDRAVGRAVGAGGKTFRQQLDKGADRRHREIAARRVDIPQLVAVAGIGVLVAAQNLEQFARAGIGVIEHRRGLGRGLPVDRHQIVGKPRGVVALGPGDGLHIASARLGEARVEQAHDRDVEPVEPDHRLVGLVAMVVPGPGRCDHEIAGQHRRALAIDRGIGALSLDNEAQCRLGVAVRRRHFARQDQLQPGEQRMGDRGLALEPGVFEDQHPARRLLGADQPA